MTEEEFSNWNQTYTYERNLFQQSKQTKGTLRFGLNRVIVSDISSQFYSETDLVKKYEEGEITTIDMEKGTQAHDSMSEDYQKVSLKEGWKKILLEDEYWVAEFPFAAIINDVIVIGKPDLVIFKKGIPVLLFEYKFTTHPEPIPGVSNELRGQYRNRHAQAQAYCLILNSLGFNTDLLFYIIIAFQPKMIDKKKEIKIIPFKIVKQFEEKSLLENDQRVFDFGEIRGYSYLYEHKEALNHIAWALDFWKGNREIGFFKG